jgi:SNF2 family DNA or RNA helicase
MGLALAPQAANYIKMLHEGGADKLVIFGWHIEVLDYLQKALDKIGVVRVDGRTSEREKINAIAAFRNDPNIGGILGNVLSLGTGTDGLQHASRHAVLVEASWVHGDNVQCIQRLHRGGQLSQVQADIFLARGSFSEHILGTALRKGTIVETALDRSV